MKKEFICLGLAGALALPVFAVTDDKTVQFLERLNLYYYCLMREGIKGFHCDVGITQSESLKKQFRAENVSEQWLQAIDHLKYTASVSPDGTAAVELVPPEATGDSGLDASVEKKAVAYQKEIQDQLKTWAEGVYKPQNDQRTYEDDCKVLNGADGFKVTESGRGSEMTAVFDRQAKLLEMSGTMGRAAISIKPDFVKTAKGYLMKGGRMKMGDITASYKYEYETVGKYWLPKSIDFTGQAPQAGGPIGFLFTFSNYHLDE